MEHLYDRLETLVLAGVDMFDVYETSGYLLGEHPDAREHDGELPWHVRRTLETGLFVTYARPFIGNRRIARARGLSEELRAFHDDMVFRRHRVYAHTDRTRLRRIIELNDPAERTAWLRGDAELREEWFPPTREGLQSATELASAHLQTLLDEIDAVRRLIIAIS
jgi:hypothetical protein